MLNTGRSWYNSLQSLYTMRMRNGINLNVNYTFSKNEARTGYLDPQNDVMQQGLVQYDRPASLRHQHGVGNCRSERDTAG